MKIEKGKLYYNGERVEKVMDDMYFDNNYYISNKIAVHCPTKEDLECVFSIFNHCNHARPFVYINEEFGERHDAEGYHIITIDEFKKFYPDNESNVIIGKNGQDSIASSSILNTQPHYDNTHGSLYKIAEQRGWNSYQFDIVKRIDRALKKGHFKEDLQKTKDLIDLWLREESN